MTANATTEPDKPRTDMADVDRRLREILAPLRERLVVTRDGPDGMILEIAGLEGKPYGYVAGIRHGKRYISFYLMSVYAFPDLRESLSPELRRRMQGKSCFNFATVDEPLFAELAGVVEVGLERYLKFADEVAGRSGPARSR